ncbi:DUF2752 domain-containing protein [Flavobacterium sp. 245]|uniref:DUF2752 domain-containing protein n=1 Tax=Flavobacterium sp. 245 TaxID=2512115 RepID=UPI0014150024|nr:DUF2752 domain-containing protein [Flavobacterium sp. 245]
MVPCLFKWLFGFDCLGCGFQRGLFLLFQGEFLAAFKMYPALYSTLLFFGFCVLCFFDKSKKHKKLIWNLAFLNLIFVVFGYYLKHFYF